MATENKALFNDLEVTFHWSEQNIQDMDGNDYKDETTLHGEDAYKLLCQLVIADKESWNNMIYGQGYWKTRFSLKYKDFSVSSYRVDLGDMTFGMHKNVADSLKHLMSCGSISNDDGESLSDADAVAYLDNLLADFKSDEQDFLEAHPEVQEKLFIPIDTYCYMANKSDWESIPENIRSFYEPVFFPDSDGQADVCDHTGSHFYLFYRKPLDSSLLHDRMNKVFVRGCRFPQYLMSEHNENKLNLVIPAAEADVLRNSCLEIKFEDKRALEPTATYTETSFFALKQLMDLLAEDKKKFSEACYSNYFSPTKSSVVTVRYQGKDLFSISSNIGDFNLNRELPKLFADAIRSNPGFRNAVHILIKYDPENTSMYGFYDLVQGVSRQAGLSEDRFPDHETSISKLLENKPTDSTNFGRRYQIKFFDYFKDLAVLRADSPDDVCHQFALALAENGVGLRQFKSLNSECEYLVPSIRDKIIDCFKTSKEVKKALKDCKSKGR